MTHEDRLRMMEEMSQREIPTIEAEQAAVEAENARQMGEEVQREQARNEKGQFVSNKAKAEPEEDEFEFEDEKNVHKQEEDDADLDKFLDTESFRSRKIKAKINGEEVEVSGEELLKNFQKERAADEKFKEAAKLQKQLAEERESLVKFQQKLIDQQNELVKSVQTQKETPALPAKDEEKEFIETVFAGDSEKAAEKLRQLINKESSAEATRRLEEVLKAKSTEMEQRAFEKALEAVQLKSWEDSLKEFGAERDDISGDEFLIQAFDAKLKAKVSELGHSRAAIKAAEKEFDSWAASKGMRTKTSEAVAKQEESKSKFLEEREARVEKARKLAAGQAASAKSGKDGEKKESELSVVEQMKRQRQPWLYRD